MKYQLEHLLDGCLSQLNEGADLEEVLAQYPAHADELRPALAASALMREIAPPPRRRLEHKAELMATVARRRRLVESVEGVVVEIKAGVPVEELLARLPVELHPAVLAAYRMQSTPTPMPTQESIAEGKQRLMALVAERRIELGLDAAPKRDLAGGLLRGLLPSPTWGRRLVTGALAAALMVSVGLAGLLQVGTAAASSLPGDNLYHVKRLGEQAQVLFAFDPDLKTTLRARFDERRLLELHALARDGRALPEDLLQGFLDQRAATPEDLARLSQDQRELLRSLLEMAGVDVADDLDPSVREALLPQTQPKSAPEPQTERGSNNSVSLDWVPSSQPRPLPEGEADEEPILEETPIRAPIADAPPAVDETGDKQGASEPDPVTEPEGPVSSEQGDPPPVVQREPDEDEPSEQPDEPAAQQPPASGQPAVGEPGPAEPGAGAEPPPVVVPDPEIGEPGGDPPPIVGPPPLEQPAP